MSYHPWHRFFNVFISSTVRYHVWQLVIINHDNDSHLHRAHRPRSKGFTCADFQLKGTWLTEGPAAVLCNLSPNFPASDSPQQGYWVRPIAERRGAPLTAITASMTPGASPAFLRLHSVLGCSSPLPLPSLPPSQGGDLHLSRMALPASHRHLSKTVFAQLILSG